jgi:hypothetical protein
MTQTGVYRQAQDINKIFVVVIVLLSIDYELSTEILSPVYNPCDESGDNLLIAEAGAKPTFPPAGVRTKCPC